MRTTAREAINLYEIELLQQALHDYEQREHWRTMKRWVDQCYAPGRVDTIAVRSHKEWQKYCGSYSRIDRVLAYDEQGEIVPYDLSKPFFQLEEVHSQVKSTLSVLGEEVLIFDLCEVIYEAIYCAGCLCKYKDYWVCTCSLPTEARTYDIAGGEPPFPWQIQIQRTYGRDGEDLHPF